MTSLPRWTAVAVVLIATLGACEGGSSDGETPSSSGPMTTTTPLSAEPARGTVISNDDFSYAVPDGWEESDQSRALSLAVDVQDEDGFVDNLNVVTDSTVLGLEGPELEAAAQQLLADASATRIRTRPPVQIDGEEAVHTSASVELSYPKYRIEQYVVAHGETGYIVTLSFSPDVPTAQRDQVSESILTTWRWNS